MSNVYSEEEHKYTESRDLEKKNQMDTENQNKTQENMRLDGLHEKGSLSKDISENEKELSKYYNNGKNSQIFEKIDIE